MIVVAICIGGVGLVEAFTLWDEEVAHPVEGVALADEEVSLLSPIKRYRMGGVGFSLFVDDLDGSLAIFSLMRCNISINDSFVILKRNKRTYSLKHMHMNQKR